MKAFFECVGLPLIAECYDSSQMVNNICLGTCEVRTILFGNVKGFFLLAVGRGDCWCDFLQVFITFHRFCIPSSKYVLRPKLKKHGKSCDCSNRRNVIN